MVVVIVLVIMMMFVVVVFVVVMVMTVIMIVVMMIVIGAGFVVCEFDLNLGGADAAALDVAAGDVVAGDGELGEGGFEFFEGDAGVYEGAEYHVSADAAEAIEVGYGHWVRGSPVRWWWG